MTRGGCGVRCRYIDGLKDDGNYMVPSTPEDESSGNALFDFGSAHGTPLSPTTGEPVRACASCAPLRLRHPTCVCVHARAGADLQGAAAAGAHSRARTLSQVPGHLAAQYWQKTGTSEEHFPDEIYQFDIEGIRRCARTHARAHTHKSVAVWCCVHMDVCVNRLEDGNM